MPDPRRVQKHLRRGILFLCALGLLYLYWRFELVRLPEAGCSPLVRVAPGNLLWFDTRPPTYVPGDVVIFADGGGSLHLGEVHPRDVAPEPGPEGSYWILTDQPDCPGIDSEQLGWIPRERLRGRMLLAR